LPADEFFGGVVVSNARADLPLLASQVDLEHHEPIGVGMGLGGFNSCDPEFHVSKFINGDHPGLIFLCMFSLDEDSRTSGSKKELNSDENLQKILKRQAKTNKKQNEKCGRVLPEKLIQDVI
jgi:hypothetical protein